MTWASATTGVIQLTMHFRYYNHGWEEKCYLPQSSLLAANTVAQEILTRRLKCLPQFCEIIYAKVNFIAGDRDGQMVDLALPLSGLYTGSDTVSADSVHTGKHLNSIEDCVAYRYENDIGQWATHWMHGVPDKEVLFDDLVNTIGVGITTPPADSAVAANGDWNLTVQAYFQTLKTASVMMRKVKQISGTPLVQTDTTRKVQSRGLSNRECGPPFGEKAGRAGPR